MVSYENKSNFMPVIPPSRNSSLPCLAFTMLGLVAICEPGAAHAQGLGVASMGASGGLTIPSAYVLDSGDMALSLGNYQPAQLGTFSRHQNYSLGFGLLPRVEVFGRFVDYQNPKATLPGLPDINGPRDISANVKWQLPLDMPGLPKLAIGATDVSGGAVNFSSRYAVASDEYGPVRWSLGYAKGKSRRTGGAKVLDGVFGGAEVKLGNTRATALAETDGTQRHAGLRYYSQELPWLGDGQVIGTVQRSFGATNTAGRQADATHFNVSLVVPLGANDSARKKRADAAPKPLPPIAPAESGAMVATAEDRMDALARGLRASGLDRVRVGTLDNEWVVEYENYRYLHNEADALGVVLGLAAEQAPAGITRVNAIALKAGQVMFETSVEVAAFRHFLRDGNAAQVKDTLGFGRLASYNAAAVQWASGDAGKAQHRSRLRVEIKPLLNYTLGTEVGAFDYSLAANVRGTASLWPGAEVYADVVQRLSHSENMAPGRVFADSLQRNGLKTLALQQSFWVSPRLLTSVGVGKYNYSSLGAEGESILFLPWNEDSVHLKGAYQRVRNNTQSQPVKAYAASYRWKFDSQTWVEAGYHQYTDRSTGPALALTRWFGDVAVQVFARKGGSNTFIGMELSLPLTLRQGMGAAPVQLSGTSRFAQSLRTLRTNSSNTGNWVMPDAVRPVDLNYKPEVELLNSGRVTPGYIKDQLQRMRESFFVHTRDQIS
jgi:hypothetical protein